MLPPVSRPAGRQIASNIPLNWLNGGQPASGNVVLPGLWQVQLGVNGQRLAEGTEFVLATADDARDSHDLLPQVKDAIGDIPGNFRPGQSIGNSCGGF